MPCWLRMRRVCRREGIMRSAKQEHKIMTEIFDFHTMQINWQGKQYPFREIDMKDKPDYVLVSVVDLERVLLGTNDFPVNSKAEWVDNKIAYYFESEEDLHQSDQVLLNIIYES